MGNDRKKSECLCIADGNVKILPTSTIKNSMVVPQKIKNKITTWPVWLSWLEHCSMHKNVTRSIPSQGTYLG